MILGLIFAVKDDDSSNKKSQTDDGSVSDKSVSSAEVRAFSNSLYFIIQMLIKMRYFMFFWVCT